MTKFRQHWDPKHFPGDSVLKNSPANAGDAEARQAIVHWVAKSPTRLDDRKCTCARVHARTRVHTHTHRQPKAVHFQEMEYLFQAKQTGPQLQVGKAMLLSAMEAKIHGLRDNIST